MTKKYKTENIDFVNEYIHLKNITPGDKQHALDIRKRLTNEGLGGEFNRMDDLRKNGSQKEKADYIQELRNAEVETSVSPKSSRRDKEQANTEHSHHSTDSKVKEVTKPLAKEPEVKEKTKEEVAIQQLVGAFNSKGSKEDLRIKSFLRNIPAISDDNLKVMFKLDKDLSKRDMQDVRRAFEKDQSLLTSAMNKLNDVTRKIHPQLDNAADKAIDKMTNSLDKGVIIDPRSK